MALVVASGWRRWMSSARWVIAAASSEAKPAAAQRTGAEVVIDYSDLKDQVRELTGGGAGLVIDPVGGPLAEAALRSMTTYGWFCVFGLSSREIRAYRRTSCCCVTAASWAIDWGDWARTQPAAANAFVAEVLTRIAGGELRPPAPTCLPLEAAAHALNLLARREVVGKTALTPLSPQPRLGS